MGGYIGNQVTGQSADSTIYLPVRQTVLIGSATSAGVPNFMAAGTGLRVALSAAATPMAIAFATGFGSYGASDVVSRLTANASDMTGSDLVASNTSYIFATYTNNAAVVWGSTLNPPQYGGTYQQNQQSLMHFEGADASTSMIDDYGNTWTANGNAQIDNAQFKIGATSLLLDGTGDFIESTNFTTLGSGSWEIQTWFRINAIGGATFPVLVSAENAGGFGALLQVSENAGAPKVRFALSSDGASNNISGGTLGTTTLSLATWYRVRMAYDALGGTYRMYLSNNGAAETQEGSVSSALKISGLTRIRLGRGAQAGLADFNGWMDEFSFKPYATASSLIATVPTTVGVVEGHWFDTTGYQMYEATTASAVAGTNPTFTTRVRCFVGEADTSGAAVAAVRNYAYQGKYTSADVAMPGLGVKTTFASNLGVLPTAPPMVFGRCMISDNGYVPGNLILLITSGVTAGNITGSGIWVQDKNTLAVTSGSSVIWIMAQANTGTAVGPTAANWKMFAVTQRGW